MHTSITTDNVAAAIQAVMAIPIGSLEKTVQESHACVPKQMDDPNEPFRVSRQALRMFWHFRCNLDAVQVFTEST